MTETCLPIVQWLKNWFTSKDNEIHYNITSSNYNPHIDSTVTITVTVTDGDDNTVPNHSFILNADGTDVSLTTNSNGVATLSYTGDGVGKMDIIAVSTISGTSYSSEKCEFIDCIALDRATQSDYDDLISTSNITRNASDSTVYIDRSAVSSASNVSTSSYTIDDGLCVQIELTEITSLDLIRVSLTGGTNQTRGVSPTSPCVVRFECRPNSTKIYVDDELSVNQTEDNITSLIFQIRTYANSINNFNYKNLAIYPI